MLCLPGGGRSWCGKAAEEVKALGRRSLVQTCDVTDEASIEKLLAAALAEFGSVGDFW